MKTIISALLLLGTILPAFAQDDATATTSVGGSVGGAFPYGYFSDFLGTTGFSVNAFVTWEKEKLAGRFEVGYRSFGKKNGIQGAYIPIQVSYTYEVYTLSGIGLYGGASIGTHIGRSDFKRSNLSFAPLIGGNYKITDDLTGQMDVRFNDLLEDHGPKYFGVEVGLRYAIIK